MALDVEEGKKLLQLLTSRYDDWRWRKKIEKTLSFPAVGLEDDLHQAIFLYLKEKLKAYKSFRADPDTWMVGGFTTKEAIERIKFQPSVVGDAVTTDEVAFLGQDPGEDINEAWWEDMLVLWFDRPDLEPPPLEKEPDEESEHAEGEESEVGEQKDAASSEVSPTAPAEST